MRKILIILTLTIIIQFNSFAQHIRDRVKAERIGYITTELELTSDEAKVFWPIYEKYSDLREENFIQMRKLLNLESSLKPEDALDQYIKLKQDEAKVETDLINSLKKVIPAEKIFKLVNAEQRFRRELIRKVKDRMKERREGRN